MAYLTGLPPTLAQGDPRGLRAGDAGELTGLCVPETGLVDWLICFFAD